MQLIKNIEGNLYDEPVGVINKTTQLIAVFQEGIYINLNGHVNFLQDLSKANELIYLTKPATFGLKNTYNIPLVTLDISL